mgnify:FL=1
MDFTSPVILSYWAPMAVFGVFTTLEGYAPTAWYPWLYLVKILVLVATFARYPACLRDIRPSTQGLGLAIAVGLVIFAQWILIDEWIPYPHLGTRVAFNPFVEIPDRAALVTMLVSRFFGLVVLVPLMEETFWRNFAMRYATNPDIHAVPIGTFSMTAFWITVAGSALTHPEWLVAVIAGVLFALVLRWTRSMFAVIVSHAVANLALGGYIVATGSWQYW